MPPPPKGVEPAAGGFAPNKLDAIAYEKGTINNYKLTKRAIILKLKCLFDLKA